MKITAYDLSVPRKKPCRIALLSDLHDRIPPDLLSHLKKGSPDLIAIAGDLIDCETMTAEHFLCSPAAFEKTLAFLTAASALAPVAYAPGNHDILTVEQIQRIRRTGAHFLSDEWVKLEEMETTVGGLASGFGQGIQGKCKKTPAPNLPFIREFDALPGDKILLCHHPEYYPAYLKATAIPLILSGHAHGGQWNFFGRGVFAPGQGLFPRYTAGVYENRLVVSRGLGNHTWIPRLFNPTELVWLNLVPAPDR